MSTVPSAEPADARQAAPVPPASGHLGGGEAAVVITAIAAVTVLAVLERPIPAVLTALAAAACLMLLPGRTGRMLAALATGSRG
ncbi:hypothetical protein [Streptomyces mirabilis]|uniref:hypothetical protein n=1 Tax=Streptomyces mirabilis TaxID=68239 RepID=UPI003669DB62